MCKFKTVPVDLKKLSDLVANEVGKNTKYAKTDFDKKLASFNRKLLQIKQNV